MCTPGPDELDEICHALGNSLEDSLFVKLAKDRRASFWSRRRVLLRLAYELADRVASADRDRLAAIRTVRMKLLDRCDNEPHEPSPRDTALGTLEQASIDIEREFAWPAEHEGINFPYIRTLQGRAHSTFADYGFERRSTALAHLWPRIEKHGWPPP